MTESRLDKFRKLRKLILKGSPMVDTHINCPTKVVRVLWAIDYLEYEALPWYKRWVTREPDEADDKYQDTVDGMTKEQGNG